jgi:hypothetical protein
VAHASGKQIMFCDATDHDSKMEKKNEGSHQKRKREEWILLCETSNVFGGKFHCMGGRGTKIKISIAKIV